MLIPELSARSVSAAFDATEAEFLGKGAFGETWRIGSTDDVASVRAVKLLNPKKFHPGLVQREIEGLSGSRSEWIMQLYGVQAVEIENEVYTALVCEYLPGGDVAEKIAMAEYPDENEVLAFALGLLRGVRKLHDTERVHRDLKPANIMLRNGRWDAPVLIDLGLSKGTSDATMTRYPARVGSLLFMSPEQLRGERARKTSDLWACGVILFMILARRHPFVTSVAGKTEDDVADEITGPPGALPADTGPELKEVILRLLSEDAFERSTAKRALKTLREASK